MDDIILAIPGMRPIRDGYPGQSHYKRRREYRSFQESQDDAYILQSLVSVTVRNRSLHAGVSSSYTASRPLQHDIWLK